MKVVNQFIVIDEARLPQMLFQCENGNWYITNKGAFGQRDMTLTQVAESYAEELISQTKESVK